MPPQKPSHHDIPSITTTESVLIVMILLVGRTGFPVVGEKEKREGKKKRKREGKKKKRETHTQETLKKKIFFSVVFQSLL